MISTVEQDMDQDSPREFDGNLGVMVLRHSRFTLPAEGDLAEEIHEALLKYRMRGFGIVERWLRVFHGASVVLPVYGYHHGELRMIAGPDRPHPFNDRFDSGVLGLIYHVPSGDAGSGDVAEALREEVAAYSAWMNREAV